MKAKDRQQSVSEFQADLIDKKDEKDKIIQSENAQENTHNDVDDIIL